MTTTHPTDGDLRAFLDGEVGPDERRTTREHLRGCRRCRDAADAMREAEEEVRRALALLDPPARADEARRGVEARLRPSFGPARSAVAKAALLILALGAGASAAVPGSPVRAWLGAAWSSVTGEQSPPGAAVTAAEAGVRVAPSEGRIRVELSGVADGTPVRVRLTDRPTAGIAAPAGARFRSAEGSIRATLDGTSSAAAEVRVELPRAVDRADVTVNGLPYLRVRGGEIQLPGPVPERSGDDYLFPGSGGDAAADPGS